MCCCPSDCLSVYLSVTWVDQSESKPVEVRITKFSLHASSFCGVSLIHKFLTGSPKRWYEVDFFARGFYTCTAVVRLLLTLALATLTCSDGLSECTNDWQSCCIYLILFLLYFVDKCTCTKLVASDIRRETNGCPSQAASPAGRRGHTSVIYGNSLYIYGGYVDMKGSSSELWQFNFGSFLPFLIHSQWLFEFIAAVLVK